jgi:hypothetical protein
VKSVNYKLSTSTYLKLGETNVFIIFFPFTLSLPLPPTFPLSPKFLIFLSFNLSLQRVRADACSVRTDAGVHPRRPADAARTRVCVRADPQTQACVRTYITPVRVFLFCSFSPLPLVGVVEFAWQRPFRLAKGEGVTSI